MKMRGLGISVSMDSNKYISVLGPIHQNRGID